MLNTPPIALCFLGFPDHEANILEATLPIEQGRRYRYARLPEGSLQEADAFLVNADDLAALATLSALGPSALRPALLIGAPPLPLPHACIPRPIRWNRLFEALDALLEQRHHALAGLRAARQVSVTERRRARRVDFDLTDPAEYRRMRAGAVADGGVLLVDQHPVSGLLLSKMLKPRHVPVRQVDSAAAALAASAKRGAALVLIDTATPDANPYHLCHEIKKRATSRTAVIFLIDNGFRYNRIEAKGAGCDGFLVKPLAPDQLLRALDKFLPAAR